MKEQDIEFLYASGLDEVDAALFEALLRKVKTDRVDLADNFQACIKFLSKYSQKTH